MGSTKKQRKKFSRPSHPWQKARLEEEAPLVKEYGLKNKTELWKMNSFLKTLTRTAKKLIPLSTPQAGLEKQHLLEKIQSFGLLSGATRVEDTLNITLRNVLDRRLQTLLVKGKLARATKQARQMITHRHIVIDNKIVTGPSTLIRVADEKKIGFAEGSTFKNADHPERVIEQKEIKTELAKTKKKEDKTEKNDKKEAKKEKKEIKKDDKKEKKQKKEKKADKKEAKPKEDKKEAKEEKPKAEEKKAEVKK